MPQAGYATELVLLQQLHKPTTFLLNESESYYL